MKKLNLFLIIGVVLTNIGMAQTQWINYTNGDGVSAIVAEGNDISVGTNGGLVKIDKTTGNTVFYNHANSGLPSNDVRSLAIDGNGTKWIGTKYGGLARFDGTTWTVYNMSNSGLPSNDVTSLAIDGNGTKWIGTGDGGLAAFNENGINSVNEQLISENDMIVFPNPAHDQLTVIARSGATASSELVSEKQSIAIYNLQGQQVKSIKYKGQSNKYKINVENLPAGLYILKVTGGKGTEVTKFIKE